jgi:hypothetical protein
MVSQKREFFDPARGSSVSLIEKLKEAGVETSAYEESLELGNIGTIVIVERILRKLVDDLELAREGVDPVLLADLDALESEVNQKVSDVRLRVVPRGLISFARELATNPAGPHEVRARELTVRKVIEVIREYVG